MERPRTRLSGPVLGVTDPLALADFYSRLLGWPVEEQEVADHQPQDGVRVMRDPAGHVFCLFPDTS